MMQQVKDLVLSLQWLGLQLWQRFDPWPQNFCTLQAWLKEGRDETFTCQKLSDDLISVQKQNHYIIGVVLNSRGNVCRGDFMVKFNKQETELTWRLSLLTYAQVGRDSLVLEPTLSHIVKTLDPH